MADTDPPERQAFDELAGSLDHAMLIVTTACGEDHRAGCLVGFHSQCSIDPPRYAVWISRTNRTYRLAMVSRVFAVHLPRADQHPLADLFGGTTGDEVDKFERCAWSPGPDGVPLLDDCPNRFVGERVEVAHTDADHVCVVLRPLRTDRDDGPANWLPFAAVKDITAGHRP
jgi:flavin reductase (DIM6/NTAB) family NADH-FMN oxidoreductase RutF